MKRQALYNLEKEAALLADDLGDLVTDTDAFLNRLSENPDASAGSGSALFKMQLSVLLKRFDAFDAKAAGTEKELEEAGLAAPDESRQRLRILAASLSQQRLTAAKEREKVEPLLDSLNMADQAARQHKDLARDELAQRLAAALKKEKP